MSSQEKKDRLEALEDQLDLAGMSFSTVKDGKLLLISREMLVKLLARVDKKGAGRVTIFIQDPPPKSKRS